MPNYRLYFPTMVFNAIHAKQAKLDALKHFEENTIQVDFEEIEDDEEEECTTEHEDYRNDMDWKEKTLSHLH